MLAGRRGEEGRVCLATAGRRGTWRKVEDLRGEPRGLSDVDGEGSVEGPGMGDVGCATAFPLALGELVREEGVAGSGTAAGGGEDTGGGDRGVGEGSLADGGETGDCTSTIGEGVSTSRGFSTSAFSDRGSGEGVCSCLRCGNESIMDTGR